MIRTATNDDIVHFIRMGRDFAVAAGEPFDRESLVQHLEWIIDTENTTALVAETDAGIVGIIAGIFFPTFWDQSKITATEMWWWVDPQARGSKVGIELMNALESWARDNGAFRLSMMMIAGVAPGIEKLYRRQGYRLHEQTFLKEL